MHCQIPMNFSNKTFRLIEKQSNGGGIKWMFLPLFFCQAVPFLNSWSRNQTMGKFYKRNVSTFILCAAVVAVGAAASCVNGDDKTPKTFCRPSQANTWIEVGPWTCHCEEHIIQTPLGPIKKYLLGSCSLTTKPNKTTMVVPTTTTIRTTTTTTTTVAPNKCPSPQGKGSIDFR